MDCQENAGGALPPDRGWRGSQRDRYRWAVRIRWMTIAGFSLLGASAIALGAAIELAELVAAALAATLLNACNQAALRHWRWIGPATGAALAGDVVLITWLVASTGGPASPFVPMYFVQVLASAMLVRAQVAIACAVSAALASAAVAVVLAAAPLGAVLIWSLFLLFGLVMVAYVGGYVSRQLRLREAALARSSSALRRTARRLDEAEGQLAQSEKMRVLGDFVAGIAHELNNPIAVASANLEILAADITGDETELVADSREAIERAARIVADLRQFSRAGVRHTWCATDLNQRARRTAELARRMFGSGVVLELDLRPLPQARVVPEQIDQLLMNLLGNAAQAVCGGGTVRLSTFVLPEQAAIVLRVDDNGPGIDRAIGERVFEPFFATRPEGEGVGLGLSLSFAIAERHGGTLRIDHAYDDGARLELVLPVPGEIARHVA